MRSFHEIRRRPRDCSRVKVPYRSTHALIGLIAPFGLLVLESPRQTQMGAPGEPPGKIVDSSGSLQKSDWVDWDAPCCNEQGGLSHQRARVRAHTPVHFCPRE
jgi:hypothetical protein